MTPPEKDFRRFASSSSSRSGSSAQNAHKIGKFTSVAAPLGHLVRQMSPRILMCVKRLGNDGPVLLLAAIVNGKPMVTVATNDLARQHSARAGQFVCRAAQILAAGGGARDDLAQAVVEPRCN